MENSTSDIPQSSEQYNLLSEFKTEAIEEIENDILAQTEANIDEEQKLTNLQIEFNNQSDIDLKRRFDDSLDSDGAINIAGGDFLPSVILSSLDENLYRQALLEFQQQDTIDLIDRVIQEYPTPIAYHFYIATKEDYPVERRFTALKDTWEALIYLLFSLILGEFTARKLFLQISNKPTWKYLCEWRLATKLDIIQKLYDLAQANNYILACQKILSPDLVSRIRVLNRVRNEFAHSATWSTSQTEERLGQHLNDVIVILRLAQELQNVKIVRFGEGTDRYKRIRFNIFAGRYLDHDTKIEDITEYTIHDDSILHKDNILVMHDSQIYSICPWYHFIMIDEGHGIRLCYFKEQDDSSLEFEVLGQARKQSFPKTNFISQIDVIENLLKLNGKPS